MSWIQAVETTVDNVFWKQWNFENKLVTSTRFTYSSKHPELFFWSIEFRIWTLFLKKNNRYFK